MNILVILAHPKKESLNHAIYEKVIDTLKANGHDIVAHDLYDENFDPALKGYEIEANGTEDPVIIEHAKHLVEADGMVIVHPTWWAQMPAMIKGWIDRVIKNGLAYHYPMDESGRHKRVKLVKLQRAVVINTLNGPAEREAEMGNPLETLWLKGVFRFLMVDDVHRKAFRGIRDSTFEQRTQWLKETVEYINEMFPKEAD